MEPKQKPMENGFRYFINRLLLNVKLRAVFN